MVERLKAALGFDGTPEWWDGEPPRVGPRDEGERKFEYAAMTVATAVFFAATILPNVL